MRPPGRALPSFRRCEARPGMSPIPAQSDPCAAAATTGPIGFPRLGFKPSSSRRRLETKAWKIKKRLQRLGTAVLRALSRTEVTDATSGFRAVNREAALRLNTFSDYNVYARDPDQGRPCWVACRLRRYCLQPTHPGLAPDAHDPWLHLALHARYAAPFGDIRSLAGLSRRGNRTDCDIFRLGRALPGTG